jgi:chromate transporter
MAGALGAALVTWFTFLPSFIFIFSGAPLIETTHNDLKFTAPLTAITAAVVGVILNLVLFFGYHVLWPSGFSGSFDFTFFDWRAAIIAAGAALALFKFKRNVIEVIAVSALLGLCTKLFL